MTTAIAEKEEKQDEEMEQPKPKRKFSRKQYNTLKTCSDKKDFSEWNQWRSAHPDDKILLEGAELHDAWLQEANLQDANLLEADLEGADLCGANLQGAYLWKSNLLKADLSGVNLQGADLWGANLQDARLWKAKLEGADLGQANLQGAILQEADLRGAGLADARIQGANFSRAIVDGKTMIWECAVDRKTEFIGVGLGMARIDAATKQLLEYNIRRANWAEWYNTGWFMKRFAKKLFVRPFWLISNYGMSTEWIVKYFILITVTFASIYFICGTVDLYYLGIEEQPGLVRDLFSNIEVGANTTEWHYLMMVYLRAFYFSVVTMTTLGFGDMSFNVIHPGVRFWAGHIMIILQVILGYILFAALITRFVVLYTAGGPAGKFVKRDAKVKAKSEKKKKKSKKEKEEESD